jgi:hypothetical protein
MKKFWRGFRKISYKDENKMRVRAEQLEKLKRIIHDGRHEAEQEYVDAVNEWKPDISKGRTTGKNQAVSRCRFGRARARSKISVDLFSALLNSLSHLLGGRIDELAETLQESILSRLSSCWS